jgi:transcriptional antiterminator NusG
MLEDQPEKTNMTENAPEETEPPHEEEVPEGVAESAAGTEEAADASDEPSPVPDQDEPSPVPDQEGSAPGLDGDSQASAVATSLEEAPASPDEAVGSGEAPAVEDAAETAEAPTPESQPEQVAAAPEEREEEEETGADPYSGPGDWYVIHTYAGYENKVKTNLASRIQTMQMQDKIFDVVIPMEDVMEIKGGRKQVVQKKVFPGYLLVKMIYDDESWFVVRNTPGVTGFVSSGTGQKPTPLSRREVERILGRKKEEAKPAFRLDFEVDDVVRIISGPFADFNGTIAEINLDQSKVKVMVNIFDRETPVELGFDQVARV